MVLYFYDDKNNNWIKTDNEKFWKAKNVKGFFCDLSAENESNQEREVDPKSGRMTY